MNNQENQLDNYANLIWKVADLLRGAFQDDDYGTIILPFALLRRIECALEPTREAVANRYKELTNQGILLETQYSDILKKKAKAPFFNTGIFTLRNIGASNTRSDMDKYLDGFSENLREIFAKFNFKNICDQLQSANLLYATIQHFKNIDLSPETVPARVMSNIYEELIWRFASTKHKASKEFLTPRDVVRLATTLVLESDGDLLASDNGQIRTIYDPTCGTCGFINDSIELIQEFADKNGSKYPPMLSPFGQEIASISWALGKTMMLLQSLADRAENADEVPLDRSTGIALGNTLLTDMHADETFDYVFSNPPFGMDWSEEYKSVSHDPRFATIGIPHKDDGSMLFLTHVARKIARNGHGAIVLSGSSLFSGGAGSGSSNIRRWLFENDIVEAIVQMSGNLFYNTPLQTYLWLLNKNKPAYKKGKIQLVDASNFKTAIKNIGKKRFIISDEQIATIARAVADFKDSEISKIIDYREFGYRAVTVQQPLRLKFHVVPESIATLMDDKSLSKLSEADKKKLKDWLTSQIITGHTFTVLDTVATPLKYQGLKLGKSVQKAMINIFGERDPNGEISVDSKGNTVFDSELKQTENIPLTEDIDTYIKREVLPFVADAIVDRTVFDEQDKQLGIVGYEVNFNKYFYKYEPPRSPETIAAEIQAIEEETAQMMKELF